MLYQQYLSLNNFNNSISVFGPYFVIDSTIYLCFSVNFNKSVGGFFASYIFFTISLSIIFFLSLYAINGASYEYFNISLGNPQINYIFLLLSSSVNRLALPASSNLFLINNLPVLGSRDFKYIFVIILSYNVLCSFFILSSNSGKPANINVQFV